ncbi:MAG: helix-turn-helix domain-containing protein [Deltaproteobacteria bacterium]|nr:helix-turn-helix domain-containing protein [Deltaproteobacteria bacterium]MBW2630081.1 helix-turn-helix domain-containing protein [Deltaproteobacteria bacterium]
MIGSWLTYAQAARYTGWSVHYLRNLVSAGQIPVYGRPRVRRFRRDMLDLYLTDPNMAMRKFRAERKRPHDR